MLYLCVGAANHDPERWGDDADAVRIDRPDAGLHVQFGGGIHHCLGAHLARLQAEVALTSMFARLPNLRPAGEPTWAGRSTLRSVSTVPIDRLILEDLLMVRASWSAPLPLGVALLQEGGAGFGAVLEGEQPGGVVLLGAVGVLQRAGTRRGSSTPWPCGARSGSSPPAISASVAGLAHQLVGARTTSRTAPSRCSSAALISSPVKNSSRALWRPTSSDRWALAPSRPTLISVVPNVACSAASEHVAARRRARGPRRSPGR